MNDTTFQGNGKITYVPVVVNEKPPKQTNADRIRSMTDEELADWLIGVIQRGGVIPYGGTGVTLDWLQQEAE